MKYLRFMRRLIVVLIVFLFTSSFIYGYFISPNEYTFKNYDYINSSMPSSLNGLKIAYISDLNLSNDKSIKRLEDIINDLNSKPFDILLFGGDLYYQDIIDAKKVSSLLKSIDCPYGKLAILGDKDLNNKSAITRILNDGGFEVMDNEVRPLYYKEASLSLIAYSSNTQISKLDIPKNGIKLTLSHMPDTFSKTSGYTHLQLSGHSYGGTIYLPYIGALHTFDGCHTYNHGLYTKKNSTLIVSNGVSGSAEFPYKLFARNQIVFITFKTSSN